MIPPIPHGHTRYWINEIEYIDSPVYPPKGLPLHRIRGPVIENITMAIYYVNSQRHREDGPAFITKYVQDWWVRDIDITGSVILWFREMNWDYNLGLDTDEKKAMFRIKFV